MADKAAASQQVLLGEAVVEGVEFFGF